MTLSLLCALCVAVATRSSLTSDHSCRAVCYIDISKYGATRPATPPEPSLRCASNVVKSHPFEVITTTS